MERQAITVHGQVQGVGFRPFVFGLAVRLQLNGFVRNRTGSVLIEVEGERSTLERFLDELRTAPPPLSRIDAIESHARPLVGQRGFRIEPSELDAVSSIFISPDVATCDACRAELYDPRDRRYRYPLLNCTHCGPRLTIIRGAPYDREHTTMASFEMCAQCRVEYEDPADRRFHAQPTACPDCGPRLQALDVRGATLPTDDPLAFFAQELLTGSIGALKGLGGYHLVCDAGNALAVQELRRRKHRDAKPFAVMLGDVATVRRYCELDEREEALLTSPARPIVLLRRRGKHPAADWTDPNPHSAKLPPICDAVAPGNPCLGVMLPYTPVHHLLLEAVGQCPLVMTSGNRSDEPIVYRDDALVDALGEIAGVFLTHNRPIHIRCDDSLTRVVDGSELPIRRSRGYAPQPLALPCPVSQAVLAVGGQLKNVFALASGRQAFLSHHLGDLDHFTAYQAFERDIELYEQLFQISPQMIVHDLHPDYVSSRYALRRCEEQGLDRVAVQHHHAHMASCMAEHQLDEAVLGVIFDGTGYGTDGTIWGGEFLVGDYAQFTRAAHLRTVPMPGGDQAIREPWRMAAAHLVDAECWEALRRLDLPGLSTIRQMIERNINSPPTSSVGRLFDAVAALAGTARTNHYEGQAAMQLEWLATGESDETSYAFQLQSPPPYSGSSENTVAPLVVDTRPAIREVVRDCEQSVPPATIARRFHSTLIEIVADVCCRIRSRTAVDVVVLSGGVFQNAILIREATRRLELLGFRVYRHTRVPPGDGGLSLGQLAVAAGRREPSRAGDRADTFSTSNPSTA